MHALFVLFVFMGLTAIEEAPINVSFQSTPTPHPVWGFGGEWDPHFWREMNRKRGCDEAAWADLCARIQHMGVNRVRMGILPDWYEPDNDNVGMALPHPEATEAVPAHLVAHDPAFTWESEPMLSLYRYLDFCQSADIRVTLTWWTAPVRRQLDHAPYWLACQHDKAWCAAPNDPDETVENIVVLLQHLIEKRGYSCIDAFTFVNEPDWTFINTNKEIVFEEYARICRALHERLRDMGLRSRIQLDLADDSMHRGWLEQTAQNLADVADRYNAHSYLFSTADADYPEKIRVWVEQQVAACGGKPFGINELGTRHYSGAYSVTDLETFERGFLAAQHALLGLNAGMTSALFWGLHDQHYYDGNPNDGSNGGMMKTNLMGYVTEGWVLRPSGQAWTLICRSAPRNARVHPGVVSAPELDGAALATQDGAVHVLLVNRATTSKTIRIENLPGLTDPVPGCRNVFDRTGLRENLPASGFVLTLDPESLTMAAYAPRP